MVPGTQVKELRRKLPLNASCHGQLGFWRGAYPILFI